MVGEDFNVVQSLSEISSGRTQPQAALDAFNLALLDCGLEDMILLEVILLGLMGILGDALIEWCVIRYGLDYFQYSEFLI